MLQIISFNRRTVELLVSSGLRISDYETGKSYLARIGYLLIERILIFSQKLDIG